MSLLYGCGGPDAPPATTGWEDGCPVDNYPAEIIDNSGLAEAAAAPGAGLPHILFRTRAGKELRAFVYRATTFSPTTGPIVFVMHGASRNAEEYLYRFRHQAERHGALAVAPEFPLALFGPGSEPYTLGLGRGRTPSGGDYRASKWRERDDYVFSEIEHLYEALRGELGSTGCSYRIWGHSAGAQFVHRLVTFRPDARLESAVAANAGYYTMPTRGTGNEPRYFIPYGLQGSPLSRVELERVFAAPLTVLVGELDTKSGEESGTVRNSWQANLQGVNRRERGRAYFDTARKAARELGTELAWRFDVVPGAGHKSRQMAAYAAWYLFNDASNEPCVPSTAVQAAGLTINEIHADPAPGADGDANGDGVRDAREDEFVELYNDSDQEICLTGWYLGDAAEATRHRFPIDSALAPHSAMLVFGGGVPKGAFGGAAVQTADFDDKLALSNDGDVLTLADPEGRLVRQLSWGDCQEQECAREHIPGALNGNQSVTRWPEVVGPFTPHSELPGGRLFSPGVSADGSYFGNVDWQGK